MVCRQYGEGECEGQYCAFAHEEDGFAGVVSYAKIKAELSCQPASAVES